MELKEIYRQLTNIDIAEQKRIWDERGKGYYGEYLLFCELYKEVSGVCKILMNLTIPVSAGNTTEIDLLLIHETGLYVFEVKHYTGTIYGKDTDTFWTQYFRTVKNEVFKNPVEQNGYHIRALKKMFPNIPIYSCVVFTNHDCDIKINNSNPEIDICLLGEIRRTLTNRFQTHSNRFSMKEIDTIFNHLSVYSQMQKTVVIDNVEADFLSWVQPVISKLEEKKAETEQQKNNWIYQTQKLKKAKAKGIFANVAIASICIIISAIVILGFQKGYHLAIQENNKELTEFKQNFLHIDEIGNEYINALNSYVNVSNVSLQTLAENAVTFTARIAITTDVYGMALTEDSKYIVMTDSGKVIEYDVFGDHLSYNRYGNMIGNGIRSYGDLARTQFFGVSKLDISYIKITGIELFKLDMNRTIVKDKLEIELYSKQ